MHHLHHDSLFVLFRILPPQLDHITNASTTSTIIFIFSITCNVRDVATTFARSKLCVFSFLRHTSLDKGQLLTRKAAQLQQLKCI
jgi:hypothetical protein